MISSTARCHDNFSNSRRTWQFLDMIKLFILQGTFAFVIFDSKQNRVLAGRDATGAQPLYWGATDDGHLMFGSVLEDLDACNPTATLFPSGAALFFLFSMAL